MPAPSFKANATRWDPYKSYRFKVKWDGNYIAGVSRVGTLRRSTEVVRHRSGGDSSVVRLSPGQSTYDPILLEQGVTHDPAFEQWANKIWSHDRSASGDTPVSLKDFRKDIIIELYNEAGQKVMAYNVYRCWVSEFQALPELDAMTSAIAIQSIKLEHEGWERNASVTEPTETAYTVPA